MEEAREIIYFGHVVLRLWCSQALANCLIHKNLPPRSTAETLRYLSCADEEGRELRNFYQIGVPLRVLQSGRELSKKLVKDHGIKDFFEGSLRSEPDTPLIVYSDTLGSYDHISGAVPLASGNWNLFLSKPAYITEELQTPFYVQAKFVALAAKEMGLPVEGVSVYGWKGSNTSVSSSPGDIELLTLELGKTRDLIENKDWKSPTYESSPCGKCFHKFCPRKHFLKDLYKAGDEAPI